ncbi:TetR/AcrR family transcriptional regulator [Trebonia sp.]|uniref:TetR/AcrR family transcriptional regulator n=1 Tax=Trebonia sp. TaxID=2767075 RepID=UPI00262E6795|nr:TetR family transcriptional regulator [Trebonia sp.]
MTETAQTGLRERSKARRREAIIRAAYQLFAERGFDATTVADIAAAAEVAPRTVAMYFPSKQDIALSRYSEGIESLTAAVGSRAPGETLIGVLDRWLRDADLHSDADMKRLALRMFAANPELNALRTARMAAAISEGAAAIAAETGTAPGSFGPHIAAVATAAILLEVTDLVPGPARDEAVTIALRFLDAGIRTLGPA